ncbi:hypothetical protein SDC9_11863 [bioreactor metagenome]|uniref:HNH endonuclease 5 domain-containing protein n=1 Tax=bioreactor metagenome TaxID=1076179 RepID=A0A644TH53_9ZZZZ
MGFKELDIIIESPKLKEIKGANDIFPSITLENGSDFKNILQKFEMIFTNISKKESLIKILPNNDVCRFCGEKGDENRNFNNSHAIPLSLGNKQQFLCLNECNICNSNFSKYLENDFKWVLNVIRNFHGIEGGNEKKIPIFKDKNEKITFDNKESNFTKLIISFKEKIRTIQYNDKTDEVIFNYKVNCHSPIAAYKTLLKMFLSLIEDEKILSNFSKIISWIQNKNHEPLLEDMPLKVIQIIHHIKNPFDKPIVYLFKSKVEDLEYFDFMFLLIIGPISFQIGIHTDRELSEKKDKNILKIDSSFFIPGLTGIYRKSSIQILDWNKTKNKDTFSFTIPKESIINFEEIKPYIIKKG